VPVEVPVYRSLSDAVARGRLRPSSAAQDLVPFILGPDLPDDAGAMLERTDAGMCVFLEPSSRLCIVHRDLGHDRLPATCRHFPRVAVHDARGTSVVLSHFCPTAASMLFREDVDLEIVDDPVSFPPADYEGLTMTGEDLPPLLTPAMLMDLDGFAAWESHMVGRCRNPSVAPESVLATLQRDAHLLRAWRPGSLSLADTIAQLPAEYVDPIAPPDLCASLAVFREVMTAVPADLRPEPDEQGLLQAFTTFVQPAWSRFHAPMNRYIAAKAFATWTAYQGRGIATIVTGIEAAVALVRVEAARQCRDAQRQLDQALLLEAFRAADFALNHLAVGQDLADNWSRAEGRV